MGEDGRLGILTEAWISEFPFEVRALPGRDLPAETGLSGNVVLRFGGVSRGKSGGTTGWGGARTRGPGELGLDAGAELRPFNVARPAEFEDTVIGDADGIELRRVGVEGRESDRAEGTVGECKFPEIWGLELGVEGLEFCDVLFLSTDEQEETERGLEGVEDRDAVGREEGVAGLAAAGERVVGEDGLV